MTDHDRDDWGDDGGLRPRLEAYADARLRPDPAASARARARVMAEARAALDARHGDATAPRRRVPFSAARRSRLRPAMLAGAWLLVALVVAGSALAASGPGGPLYAARLWIEELALPAAASPRAEAQADRLEDRLAEAQQAAREGNGAAVTAALEAYRAAADAALATAGEDPTLREHLAAQLGRHVAVLETLAAGVPEQAAGAILAAVERTEERIEQILARSPAGTPGPARTPPGKPEATPNSAATSKPDRTPPGKPEATPTQKPEKSPTAKPEATPKP